MEELIRLWRYLPRFLFGFLLVLGIAVIFLGRVYLSNLSVAVLPLVDWKAIGSFASGIVVVVLIATISSFGLFLLEVSVALMSIISTKLTATAPVRKAVQRLRLVELVCPLSAIIEMYLAKNQEVLAEYTLLKGQAMPDQLEKTEPFESYFIKVRAFLNQGIPGDLIQVINYYGSVTQDQRKLERFEDQIKELYYFLIVEFVLVVALLRVALVPNAIVLILAITISVLVTLPVIRQRKIWLATYISIAFVDVFTAGAGSTTTVEDREGGL